MFSGIIETTGKVKNININGTNKDFKIETNITSETYIDQSIAHNGVCLTVVKIDGSSYIVTAIQETLDKTNLGSWEVGDEINIERSLTASSRIDGHFVQGHVDSTAKCIDVQILDGSWYFKFEIDPSFQNLLVNKGSICINGVSLTVVESTDNIFNVAIIPYTFEHTNFKNIQPSDVVNIEFDVLGKYIIKYLEKIHKA